MEKKNPFVTTVGFKKDDPDHIFVAEFLNSMGRGKAQYIVKAVLLYQNMQKSGEAVSTGGTYNYERIRRVVLQVLEERDGQSLQIVMKHSEVNIPKEEAMKSEDVLDTLDDNSISDIRASLVAFQQQ